MTLSEELRNKPSRDNRDLLDRAADRIEELENELLIKSPKSNNSEDMSNKQTDTNYDRIKNMSLDEMTAFFVGLTRDDILTVADRYICKRCKAEHGGKCSMSYNDDECLYNYDKAKTIETWLKGEEEGAADGDKQ